jgi:cobalt-zinc-cadmium efflux system membrane fusion protein
MSSPPKPPSHLPDSDTTWLGRLWSVGQFVLALLLTVAFLVYLLVSPVVPESTSEQESVKRPQEVIELTGPLTLRLVAGTLLEKRLERFTVRSTILQTPLLNVTGTVVASRRPGKTSEQDFWQFNAPELLTTVADWEKARADIEFAQTQLQSIRELAEQRLKAQQEVVTRLKQLVAAGTDSLKDLRAEENNLLQLRIQSRKEIYEAETAVRIARRSEGALARQIAQSGIEPSLLVDATPDLDIVLAEVPESQISLVRKGQSCQARFFGLPKTTFSGKVNSIAPVLSRERRMLRVLFTIFDPEDLLRPGMFAEIGLGTDPHPVLQVPAEAPLHIGQNDYVLVEIEPRHWRIVEVKVGEMGREQVEILSGLNSGDIVLGKGAILLKPFVARALEAAGESR